MAHPTRHPDSKKLTHSYGYHWPRYQVLRWMQLFLTEFCAGCGRFLPSSGLDARYILAQMWENRAPKAVDFFFLAC